MKILLFGLNGRGGMLHYTSQYANALAKHAEVYVVLPGYSDEKFFDKTVNLIRIKAPPSIAGSLVGTFNFFQHLRLLKKINQIRPDIVHIMDNHPWYLWYSKKLRKYPLFVTQHDPVLHSGESKTIFGRISSYVNKVLRKRADKLIVHGENLVQEVVKLGIPKSKLIGHPHGDYSVFLRWAKEGVKQQRFNVLSFGRLVRYKGTDTFIKAISIVAEKIPQVKGVIAGSGDFSPYNNLITDENRRFFEIRNEFIPDEEVAEYFQRAAVVALPYDDASQSGPLNIALAFKKPVIVTDVGSLPDAVEDGKTGYVIPPKNPQALAKKIISLLENPEMAKRFGEEGFAKMKKMFGWDMIAGMMVRKYLEQMRQIK